MTDLGALRLLTFLRNLAAFLRARPDLLHDNIRTALDGILSNLNNVRAMYEPPPPAGTEAIRDCMLDTLDLYTSAIEEFHQFLEDRAPAHLDTGVAKAEEADDVLGYIEYLIQQSKHLMRDYEVTG